MCAPPTANDTKPKHLFTPAHGTTQTPMQPTVPVGSVVSIAMSDTTLRLPYDGWTEHAGRAALEAPHVPILVDVTTQAQLEEVLTTHGYRCSIRQVTVQVRGAGTSPSIPQVCFSAGSMNVYAVMPLFERQSDGEEASFTFRFNNGGAGWPLWRLFWQRAQARLRMADATTFLAASVLLRLYEYDEDALGRFTFPVTTINVWDEIDEYQARFENGMLHIDSWLPLPQVPTVTSTATPNGTDTRLHAHD